MSVVIMEEEERLCGQRRPGGYLVSPLNCESGNIHVGQEASGVIMLETPVAVDPREVPKRGFIYVEGDAIIQATASPAQPHPIRRIPPADAAQLAFAWCAFGLRWERRANAGLLHGIGDAMRALTTLDTLQWQDRDAYLRNAVSIKGAVDALRNDMGDVPLLPLVVGIMDAYNTALDGYWRGTTLRGAGATVAATWRLLQAACWCGYPRLALRSGRRLLPAAGAENDVHLALNYSTSQRDVPDVLDWVGESHYPTVKSFVDEAERLGVSRRCPSAGPPKGVVSGWSRAFLSHAKCKFHDNTEGPGIFGYYLVAQMQYVVSQDMKIPPAYRQRGSQGVQVRHLKRD